MNKYTKSKTSLFLMEFIITIMLFSFCGAICMQLFAKSNSLSQSTYELNNAVAVAQGFAEVMRGTGGTIDEIIEIYPNAIRGGEDFFEVFYDKDFKECEYSDAVYVGDVTIYPNGAIQNIEVRVVRLSDYEEIYSLSATKYMNKVRGSRNFVTGLRCIMNEQNNEGGCA